MRIADAIAEKAKTSRTTVITRSLRRFRILKTETDQAVRLGPDRRFPSIKTGGNPLSRQRVSPRTGISHRDRTVSLRPKRLTRPPSMDGWIGSEPSHFPAIGGKAGFRPELAGAQIPPLRGISCIHQHQLNHRNSGDFRRPAPAGESPRI